jgi:cytochrome P450
MAGHYWTGGGGGVCMLQLQKPRHHARQRTILMPLFH